MYGKKNTHTQQQQGKLHESVMGISVVFLVKNMLNFVSTTEFLIHDYLQLQLY